MHTSMKGCLVFLLLLAACSSGGSTGSAPVDAGPADAGPVDAGPDVVEFTLQPRGHLLPQGDVDAIQSDVGGVLVFKGAVSDAVKHAARKDVLLGGSSLQTPRGFVRLVKSATSSGDTVTLTTLDVPLQMGFSKLHLRALREKRPADWSRAPVATAEQPLDLFGTPWASLPLPGDVVVFDGDGDPSSTDDQMRAHLSASVQFDIGIGIDFEWGLLSAIENAGDCFLDGLVSCALPKLTLDSNFNANADVSGTIEGTAYLNFKKVFPLVTDTVIDVIPIGPLTVTIEGGLDVTATGRASSHFRLGGRAQAQALTGFSWSTTDGLSVHPLERHSSFSLTDSSFSLDAEAKLAVSPRLKAKLYGAIGPSLGFDAYSRITVKPLETPCVQLYGGLDITLGVQVGLPAFPVPFIDDEKVFGPWEDTLDTATCPIPAGAPRAPGTGPDLDTLLHPTFTPWVRVVTSPALAGAVGSELSWSQVSRSIDGRFTVTGKPFGGLLKLDETGPTRWGRGYVLPDPPHADIPLKPQHTAPTEDGQLFVVAEPRTLLKVSQAGTLRWAQQYDVPNQTDDLSGLFGQAANNHGLSQVVPDGDGAFVFGSRQPTSTGPVELWRLRVDGQGAVTQSLTYTLAGRGLFPVAAIPVEQDVVVVAFADEPDYTKRATVALRLAPDGTVVWATRFDGCSEAGLGSFRAVTALLLQDGTVAMAGRTGDYDKPAIFRVRTDGQPSAAIATQLDALSDGTFTALAELPGQSLVAAGEYNHGFDGRYFTLFGLDYLGQVAWQHSYQLAQPQGAHGRLTAPSLAVTDDGAIVAVGDLDPSVTGFDGGGVLAMKVAAKDGLAPASPEVTRTEFPGTPLACTPVTQAVTVTKQVVAATAQGVLARSAPLP